jgi:hypothetical protein
MGDGGMGDREMWVGSGEKEWKGGDGQVTGIIKKEGQK